MVPNHGFNSVDEQPDPSSWVAVLDRLRAEPFYVAYKKRTIEILQPGDGASYLDLGAGTGDDARLIKTQASCLVVAADRSMTMATACRARGEVATIVCDAMNLPFADLSFNGCRCDRTLQHLPNPEFTAAEMARVTKAGGRVITVDPDYDTQVMELADQDLARRVLRYRADYMLRNGRIAHRMPSIFRGVGLTGIEAEAMTLILRDPHSLDNVMGLKPWASAAAENGFLTSEEAERFDALFLESVNTRTFFYGVTFFVTWGIKTT